MASGESEFARQKPMMIEHVFGDERQRLSGSGMSDEDRAWRAQWCKDQILQPDEGEADIRPDDYHTPATERWMNLFRNPIKRAYRLPWNGIQVMITPLVGPPWARSIRYYTPKCLMILGSFYLVHYYFKYHQNDWTREGGWRVFVPKPKSWPGEPDFPRPHLRENPWDYADRGFQSRKVFLNLKEEKKAISETVYLP